MSVTLDWREIALRLLLTVVAGLAIGWNRGEHGRPAGMRTTLLVCLAASLSMLQANVMMGTVGKAADSFVVIDLMRLPLGVLSGMGFIGAGAILRKDSLVLGVTTAGALWFTTIMGLCFGGGQIGLGLAALGLGLLTLWGLKYVERMVRQDHRGLLVVTITDELFGEEAIRARIAASDCRVISWGVLHEGKQRRVRCEIERRILPDETRPPPFVAELSVNPHVAEVEWRPQGMAQALPSGGLHR